MKKIISIILIFTTMGSFLFSSIRASAQEEVETEYSQVVQFISNNLSEFKREYNQTHLAEPLLATSVEKHCLVYILDSNEFGVYLDFNDDRGYLVTSLSYDLYDINTEEDLEYLKDKDFTYYSTFDGFLYHDGASYQKYVNHSERMSEIVYSYNGQSEPGESKIYSISDYVSDRYPSYTLEEERDNIVYGNYYSSTRMMNTSYYLKYISKDGGYHFDSYQTEANCALNAAFNVMNSWQKKGIYPNLPIKSVTRDIRNWIKQDPDYQYYGEGEDIVGHDFYWAVNYDYVLSKIPELYFQARLFAVENEKYDPTQGLTTTKTTNVMKSTLEYYNYTASLKTSTNFSDVITAIQEDKAVFMGIANSISYGGNHAVALLGYRKYSYKTGVWIFEKTHIAYFFLIDDGQVGGVIYFDPNCNSSLSYEFIYI